MNETTKSKSKKRGLLLLIALAFLVLALLVILLGYLKSSGVLFGDKYFGVIEQSTLVKVDYSQVPQDMLYITPDRKSYKDGKMRLIIPVLDLDVQVGENTRPEDLEEMPGLYEFSQMPSEGDVNVSIAGHRDIFGKEFYSLDKINFNDKFYLVYEDTVFEYVYYSLKVVNDDDWSVIYRQGFSALTLTTCEPIGTRLHRLVSVGRLVDSYPFTETTQFPL